MAVKSAGDPDPYAAQRAITQQKQRNQRNARILSSLRSSASQNHPAVPKYLKKSLPVQATTQSTTTSVTAAKRTISRLISGWM